MYGYENWIITKRIESMLDRFERKILRRIFGPIVDNEVWRIRRNEELYELLADPANFVLP